MRLLFILILLPFLADAQCLKGDCENGQGTYRFKDGSTFEGEFVNGKIGQNGILYFANGDKYLGEWKDQKRHGQGKMIFATGDIYRGNFVENRFSGYGEITYIEGDVYKGQWEHNLPNGQGTMYYADGTVESGYFVDGAIDGGDAEMQEEFARYEEKETTVVNDEPGYSESQTSPSRSKFDEDDEWDDDFEKLAEERRRRQQKEREETVEEARVDHAMPDDLRVFEPETTGGYEKVDEDVTMENEHVFEEPKDDAIDIERILTDCNSGDCHNETGYFTYKDGSRYEGFFVDGQPEGEGVCYYANGDKYVGQWHNHSPHGEGIMYFLDGKVLGAIWDHGQPAEELKAKESLELVRQIYTEKDEAVKVWAVIIGVSRYDHMPVLKYSDDDAYRFYAFLKSPEGGAVRDDQIKILIDEDATRETILKMLQHTLLRADDNDVVLVYFSGHGLEGSFLPIDYDGYNNVVRHDEVIEILSASKARYKMCFADACHSGSLTAKRGVSVDKAIERYYNAFLDVRGGTAFMLSSKAREFSLEDGGLRQGVFSHFLIRGMKGEADVDFNNIVTIDELYKFVHFEVRRYTGNVQTPVMLGRYDKRMPVSVIR
ncbi:MAG: caspase family protein [Saprospiraceae bacterium]|nr:caspase family protein [Saprospiraceae bacterium]